MLMTVSNNEKLDLLPKDFTNLLGLTLMKLSTVWSKLQFFRLY